MNNNLTMYSKKNCIFIFLFVFVFWGLFVLLFFVVCFVVVVFYQKLYQLRVVRKKIELQAGAYITIQINKYIYIFK